MAGAVSLNDAAARCDMPDDLVLRAHKVSKKFCTRLRRSMFYGITDLSRNLVGIRPNTSVLRKDEFWAIDDVSFEVQRGEVLGIIGNNGSGKSTLLRLLAGIFPPDRGEVAVRGRVGALIALGAGFHPHMTGRENIYLNGAILGMTRREIQRNEGSIIEFADVGDFIDAPVSTYSSGMRVRLGFAVASHLSPDVLIVDEVLAVGDEAFRKNCHGRLEEDSRSGRAVLFVSHNMASINRLCNRCLLLHRGRVVRSGAPEDVVGEYLGTARAGEESGRLAERVYAEDASLPMQIRRVAVLDSEAEVVAESSAIVGEWRVQIDYDVRTPAQTAYVMCAVSDPGGRDLLWTYDGDGPLFGNRVAGSFRAEFTVPKDMLTVGRYVIRTAIVDTYRGTVDYPAEKCTVHVEDLDSLLAHRGIKWPGMLRWNPPWRTVPL